MSSKIYQEYPKTVARDDFWRQVKRTVNGVPVSQAQIDMIVSAISDGLSLSPQDVLLDLGCGNGALSQYFFEHLAGFEGIDASEYLVGVANEFFNESPIHTFTHLDILTYLKGTSFPQHFTKCLCYGTFHFLEDEAAVHMLELLHSRFLNIDTVFIGSSPDRDRAHLFNKDFDPDILDRNDTAIGVWRSKDTLIDFANQTGWNAEIRYMPEEFHAAHYRFDTVLHRR